MQLVFSTSPLITAVVGSLTTHEPWPPKLWETLGLTLLGSGMPFCTNPTAFQPHLHGDTCCGCVTLTGPFGSVAGLIDEQTLFQMPICRTAVRPVGFVVAGGLRSSAYNATWRDPLGILLALAATTAISVYFVWYCFRQLSKAKGACKL